MFIVLLFAISNALVSMYLEKNKMKVATIFHAVTFAFTLTLCALVNINPQILHLIKNFNASPETIEFVLMFADKDSYEVSEIIYLLELVTWVLVAAIIACQVTFIIQKINIKMSFKFAKYTYHPQNRCKSISNIYSAPICKMMVMRC